MLEQLKIQKEISFQPPQSPCNANKLQQYFDSSSFLQQQQQLAVFIKNLPIINLKQTKSINTLISSLIKQNQLVGQKCQQQISLLKQEYLKHDKLIKSNKQLKIDKQKLEKQKKEKEEAYNNLKFSTEKQYTKKQDSENKQRRLQAQCLKNNTLLKQASDKITKLQQFIGLICTQQFKKCQQFIKYNPNYLTNCNNLQQYCQNQRKKSKYFIKIKNIVQQFCIRLQKITKVVSPTVLASQLSTQTKNMLQLIEQIFDNDKSKKKRKRTQGSSQKTFPGNSQLGAYSYKNISFFEGMLQRLTQCASNNNTTKQTIVSQLEQVKSNLQKSKNHYENILKNLKQQFQLKQQQTSKKFHLKQQTIKFYEEQVQKYRQNCNNLKIQIQQLNHNNKILRRQLQQKHTQIQDLESKIQNLIKNNQIELNRIKQQTQLRIQELKKMAVIKIQQRDQIINQFTEKRKKQQLQHQKQISQLKLKFKAIQQQNQQKQKQLKIHIKNYHSLENQFRLLEKSEKQKKFQFQKITNLNLENQQKSKRKNQQLDQYKQTLSSLEHQKSLQTAYINQLQAKIETLNNKIKTLQNKSKADATSKKQITSMKNTIVQEKQKIEQYQSYCSQLKQQNQRLKSIVKQMKKQLQQVYIRLSQLKHIEAERQRLYIESQNSDRERAGILKQHEELKFQMLKLQAQNKKMELQLKHFRNIVNRIKFYEEE